MPKERGVDGKRPTHYIQMVEWWYSGIVLSIRTSFNLLKISVMNKCFNFLSVFGLQLLMHLGQAYVLGIFVPEISTMRTRTSCLSGL